MSSGEQLDQAMTVTSPMSWLALLAVTGMIVIAVIWSIVGRIPVTVTAKGIISSPVSTNAVYAPEAGSVEALLVTVGNEIEVGTPIMNYRTGNGEVRTVLSNQYGIVTNLLVEARDADGKAVEVKRGEQIIRLSPILGARQLVVSYVKQVDAEKLRRGMEANVLLTSRDANTYGHMRARILNIDSYVSENAGMAYVLGNDSNQIAMFRDGNVHI